LALSKASEAGRVEGSNVPAKRCSACKFFPFGDRGFVRSKTGGCATRPKILPWVAFLGSDMLAAISVFSLTKPLKFANGCRTFLLVLTHKRYDPKAQKSLGFFAFSSIILTGGTV